LSVRTAFTWAPGPLRYTGVDANISTSTSAATPFPYYEPLTGDVLKPYNVPDYSWNASLWYDDGKLNARASMQVVAERVYGVASASSNPIRTYATAGALGAGIASQNFNPGSASANDLTRYLDLKIGYKYSKTFEVFAEVRNAARKAMTRSQPYVGLENAPSLHEMYYSGTRVTAGLNLRY
jgi:hypothetical protein